MMIKSPVRQVVLYTLSLWFGFSVCGQAATPVTLQESPTPQAFSLVAGETAADFLAEDTEPKVVRIAAQALAQDVQRVSGRLPQIRSKPADCQSGNAVLIGTLGRDGVIDSLVRSGKIDPAPIRGKWESFSIVTVRDPFPGLRNALVIVGSDRRGTSYGVFQLSEIIGVSPWVWWADVTPKHRDTLLLSNGSLTQSSPDVKYRGIFLNDEDWGLQPWAAKTFEPETRDIGPKTYAKICELLLRLKANYLWPAMHHCTKAFNAYPQNKVVADDYAIVMGSSHPEPMLRNNVSEWDPATQGEWNYDKNRENIVKYWEDRVKENGRYENTYTLGMRGIHDSPMTGGGTTQEKVARMQTIFDDQRAILARNVNPAVEQVPQIFVPYKEVLGIYQSGLKVPDDVILVWPDDNHGYIRQLSDPAEQKRRGGAGIYYHVSYYGAPADYLWLCTTPPALIWEEMRKAYDNGARTVWIVNVGDIKPGEIAMDFFLRMAWDVHAWDETAPTAFLTAWAQRTFGPAHAIEIAAILNEYYSLNASTKPEHIYWAAGVMTEREKADRRARFSNLVTRLDALRPWIPPEQQDAFFELIAYPVRCSALMNTKYLSSRPEEQLDAYLQIQAETKYYNEELAGGKWQHMMSDHPRDQLPFRKPPFDPVAMNKDAPPYDGIIGAGESDTIIPANRLGRVTTDSAGTWKSVPGLGRSGGSMAFLPTTAALESKPELEYGFDVATSGLVRVTVYCLPTHSLRGKQPLRYAASVDAGPDRIVDLEAKEFSAGWARNVLRAAAIDTAEYHLAAGRHTLTLRPLDPGIIFDQILIHPEAPSVPVAPAAPVLP